MKLEILEMIVRLVVLIMAGVVIPALKKWLETKTENEQTEKVRSWAYTVVFAAEQLYNHTQKLDPDGSLRKKYARNTLHRICLRSGIDVSERELDALIEAAVLTLASDRDGGKEDGEEPDNH